MSRLAKKPILIPEKTEVKISGNALHVKGPLGEISRELRPTIAIEVSGKEVHLKPLNRTLDTLALWGTYAAHVNNMIKGVNQVFQKKLIIEGIGYKVELKGVDLVFSLGFSHQKKVPVPKNIKVVVEKGMLAISGVDKDAGGQFASNIRDLKKPEPYKGKGIRYDTEVIRRKQGKKTT